MGADYKTILVPGAERASITRAIAGALDFLGCRITHCEAPATEDGFVHCSGNSIFVGPSGRFQWAQIASWFWVEAAQVSPLDWWGRTDQLAMSLSRIVKPVIEIFSTNSGYGAGYRIYSGGEVVEGQSLQCTPKSSSECSGRDEHSRKETSILGGIIGEPSFEYEEFMRGFRSLEVATAAFAARFGVSPQLIEPLDIEDGDGAIDIIDGVYTTVKLPGWLCICYEKPKARDR